MKLGKHNVNHKRLKHVGLHFQICWHGNPYQSYRRMAWPSPFWRRRMLYSPRCHHRIPQATSGLTNAGQEVFRKCISQLHVKVSQFLPHLRKWASLRLGIVNMSIFRHIGKVPENSHTDFRKINGYLMVSLIC
jgi:hypothetical protein